MSSYSMYLALGYRCNHKCRFCPCGKNEILTSAASLDNLISAIQEGIHNHSVSSITLSGGEPTLHPNFREILDFCLQNRLNVGVLSNGDALSNPQFATRCFGGLDGMHVSLTTAIHSCCAEVHEKVTLVSGSFQRTINGLKNVMQLGIPVTVKQVISRWNYQELPEFIHFLFREFGHRISITFVGMDFCGMDDKIIQEASVPFSELGSYLETALDQVITFRKDYHAFPVVSVTDLPLCCTDPYYWQFFTKVSRGAISQYSAPATREGDVHSSNDVTNNCDTYYKACRECCVQEFCPGTWESSFRYFGESAVHTIKPDTDIA